jgi:molybdenum cofactor guanylyltransferase
VTGEAAGAEGRWLGAVLAGGRSSRFGSPKWRAPLAGAPMGARAVAALAPHTARVIAVASDPSVAALGVEVWPDLEPGQGPLGGIRTALAGARDLSLAGVFVLACDLPLAGAALVRALIDAAGEDEAVVPLGPSGAEPLCALYRVSALPAVEAALRRGERSPRRLIETLSVRTFPLDRSRTVTGLQDPFLNVNTSERHALAEAALGEGP